MTSLGLPPPTASTPAWLSSWAQKQRVAAAAAAAAHHQQPTTPIKQRPFVLKRAARKRKAARKSAQVVDSEPEEEEEPTEGELLIASAAAGATAAVRDSLMEERKNRKLQADQTTDRPVPMDLTCTQPSADTSGAAALPSEVAGQLTADALPLEIVSAPVKKKPRLIRPTLVVDEEPSVAADPPASVPLGVTAANSLAPAALVSPSRRRKANLNPYVCGGSKYLPWVRSPSKQRLRRNQQAEHARDAATTTPLRASVDSHGMVTLVADHMVGTKRVTAMVIDDDIAVLESDRPKTMIDLATDSSDSSPSVTPPEVTRRIRNPSVAVIPVDDDDDELPRTRRRRRLKLTIKETPESESEPEMMEEDPSEVEMEDAPPVDAEEEPEDDGDADWVGQVEQPDEEAEKAKEVAEDGDEGEEEGLDESAPCPIPSLSQETFLVPPSIRSDGSNKLHLDSYPFAWLNTQSDEPPPPYRQVAQNVDTEGVIELREKLDRYFKSGCNCPGGRCKRDLFECNSSCSCGPECGNRVVQREAFNSRLPFYLFRTSLMMWGVKCSAPIPAGTYLSAYTGLRKTEAEALGDDDSPPEALCDEYMFTVNPNILHAIDMPEIESLLDQLDPPCDTVDEALQRWPRVTIDALECGSLARFINHSCSPNVTSVQVFTEERMPNMAHISYFARVDVPAHTELLVSYHYELNSRQDGAWPFVCGCNTIDCGHPLFNKERVSELYDPSQSQAQSQRSQPSYVSQSIPSSQPTPAVARSKVCAQPTATAAPSDKEQTQAAVNSALIDWFIREHDLTSHSYWTQARRLSLESAVLTHRPRVTAMQTNLIRDIKAECIRRERKAA